MASYKVQENISAIVAISQQYKDCESLSEISRPFDINFGESTTLQDKYDALMSTLTQKEDKIVPKTSAPETTPKNTRPKLKTMKTENLNESEPGSLDIKLPDSSSLDISMVSNVDVLSTAKLVYKLRNDVAPTVINKDELTKTLADVRHCYQARCLDSSG